MVETKQIQTKQMLQRKLCMDCVLNVCCKEEFLTTLDGIYYCENYTLKDL